MSASLQRPGRRPGAQTVANLKRRIAALAEVENAAQLERAKWVAQGELFALLDAGLPASTADGLRGLLRQTARQAKRRLAQGAA